MNEHNAIKLADRYARSAGDWCSIVYAAQMLIDWRDLCLYVTTLRA